jgi:predicted SnoaL-like aldol condensation-catalyzing enzyme
MSQADVAAGFMEAMERRDWDTAFASFTERCRWHSPGTSMETVGRDAAKREFSAFVERTAARYRVVETHEHKNLTTLFFEGEATNGDARVSFPGVVIVRWEDGQVAELWGIRG